MHVILSAILLLLAIFNLVMGTSFLVDPVAAGTTFGLEALTEHGNSTMRGDMTAFFYVSAISLAWGAWKRRGDVLLAAFGLFAIALTGRFVNLVANGPYDAWMVPVTVESLHVIAIIVAIRAWGWPRPEA